MYKVVFTPFGISSSGPCHGMDSFYGGGGAAGEAWGNGVVTLPSHLNFQNKDGEEFWLTGREIFATWGLLLFTFFFSRRRSVVLIECMADSVCLDV